LLALPSRKNWELPFNDIYINYSRDNLPNYNRISDIVNRILAITEQAIIENGGEKFEQAGKTMYKIVTGN